MAFLLSLTTVDTTFIISYCGRYVLGDRFFFQDSYFVVNYFYGCLCVLIALVIVEAIELRLSLLLLLRQLVLLYYYDINYFSYYTTSGTKDTADIANTSCFSTLTLCTL